MSKETEFERMLKVDLRSKTKTKGKGRQAQSYLSWASAWAEFKKMAPSASYEVVKQENGQPYYADEFGIMIETSITVGKETHTMWMPVLDGANNAMKKESYAYKVKKYEGTYPNAKWNGKYDEKVVQAVTMFDINTSTMRCFVKNMAMFGFCMYLYEGEDAPSADVIGMQQVNEITSLLNEKGINLQVFNQSWNMQKLTELHACNFSKAVEWIEGYQE